MSLEYGLEFVCLVRRRVSEAELRELARIADINARLVKMSLNSSIAPSEDMIRFVEESAEKLHKLDEILPVCRQCPANFMMEPNGSNGETVGCLGRINYPIDAGFEHFLASRIQLILDLNLQQDWPRALQVLADPESPFDGEATKELRRITTKEGLRFFELKSAIRLIRRASHLTMDAIFDLLAGFAAEDEGASGYWRELPVIALPDYNELFEAVFGGDLTDAEKERMTRFSKTFRQYLKYAEAIKRADELQVRMMID